jgi:hypothetical protein
MEIQFLLQLATGFCLSANSGYTTEEGREWKSNFFCNLQLAVTPRKKGGNENSISSATCNSDFVCPSIAVTPETSKLKPKFFCNLQLATQILFCLSMSVPPERSKLKPNCKLQVAAKNWILSVRQYRLHQSGEAEIQLQL